MSPLVIGARSSASAKAAEPETSPTPAVIAPAATMPFFKNDRRFFRPLNAVPSFFISFSFSRIDCFKRAFTHLYARRKAGQDQQNVSRVKVSGSQNRSAPALVAFVAATPPGSVSHR